jgi:hypothetical protein
MLKPGRKEKKAVRMTDGSHLLRVVFGTNVVKFLVSTPTQFV